VIQIFTKRGASGAAKWNVTANTGFSTLQKFGTDSAPLLFMDPFLRNTTTNRQGETEERFGPENYAMRYGTAVQVSGGQGDNLRYLLSGQADNTDGVLPNDKDRKYQLRANLDFTPLKNIAVNWSTGYTNNLINQTPAGNNAQGVTLNAFRRDRNYFGNANPDTIARVFEQRLASTSTAPSPVSPGPGRPSHASRRASRSATTAPRSRTATCVPSASRPFRWA
jgi:hypothetical protein